MRAAGGKEDTINNSQTDPQRGDCCGGSGKLYVVGIGPGGKEMRTLKAERVIRESSVVVGYKKYLDLIRDLTAGKELISSGMTKETERCQAALDRAAAGAVVALVSSGDPGVYGMAGLALEMAHKDGLQFPVEIVPGVSAANAAAAGLGAPLMLDFACISLSDLLVPWNVIRERLKAVASADLAVALYNPKSRKRTKQIEEAVEILLQSRGPETPVGIVSDAGTEDETVVVTDLGRVLDQEIHMRSAVIVGNSTTKVIGGRLVTPRGYEV